MKICLWGYHSRRTPFSYPVYQRLLKPYFSFTDDPTRADVLISGAFADFKNNRIPLANLLKKNPNLKFSIFSEEPLWDTLWGGDYEEQSLVLELNRDTKIRIYRFNHSNSDSFDFECIPYFLTTDNKYIDHYRLLYNKVLTHSPRALMDQWQKADYQYAFVAEHRIIPKYEYWNEKNETFGLSCFRTELAESLQGPKTFIAGKGWYTNEKRQSLPDWHLEKLSKLYFKTKYVSALENTHQVRYISEKVFDAYAIGAVPIIFASQKHSIHRIFRGENFINMYKSLESSPPVKDLNPVLYLEQVQLLADKLSVRNLEGERVRRVQKIRRIVSLFDEGLIA